MASTTPAPAKETTFRSYSAEQAKSYANHRGAYTPALYDIVLKHHSETGGSFGLLLDVGCGPGNATRDVALSFDEAIGVDPGVAMIGAAKDLGGKTKSGKEIRYEIGSAEGLSSVEVLEPNSVDLLTAATAAHWFEMDKFWGEAAKVVKPGGTVALWTRASSFCHPDTPNAAKFMDTMNRLGKDTLGPYTVTGNNIANNMYDDLPLPWDIPNPVSAFPQSQYIKHEFDRDGILSNGVSFFSPGHEVTVDQAKMALGTTSQVTRWREAHPDLAGTDQDVVEVFARQMLELLPEDKTTKLLHGSGTVILLFKKVED